MGTADTHTHTHTYIGNDRELADSTENVVPNPWRQHVHEKRERGKGKCVCVWCVYLCKSDRQTDKETNTEGQSGVKEKKSN